MSRSEIICGDLPDQQFARNGLNEAVLEHEVFDDHAGEVCFLRWSEARCWQGNITASTLKAS